MSARATTCLMVLLASAALSQPAAAQDAKRPTLAEQAAQHFQRGVELYDEADFRTALIEFKRAHETVPDFRVLYNIAQCEYQLSDYAAALDHFRQYLEQGGGRVTAQRRSDVERDIRRLEQRVATLNVVVDTAGAEIFLDGERVGTSPLGAPLRVSAGNHELRVRRDGYREVKRAVALAGGDAPEIRIELGPPSVAPTATATVPATAPVTPAAGDASSAGTGDAGPSLATIGFVATGVFVVAAGVTGVVALSASSDLRDKKRTPGTPASTLDSARSRATGFALATDVLAAAAVLTGAASVYFTLRPLDRTRSAARVSAAWREGPGIVVDGSF